LAQLDKLEVFKKIRQRNFQTLKAYFKQYEDIFILPEELPGADTAWLAFPLTIRQGSPFSRYEMTAYLENNGVQTRPVFTGNILRQPGFKKMLAKKSKSGYPVADKIMRDSILIGCHHGMSDEHLNFLKELFNEFFKKNGIMPR